jgi:hypothetical protein
VTGGVALQDHCVARGEDDLTVNDEERAKGLVTSCVRLLSESYRLSKEGGVNVAGRAHAAAVLYIAPIISDEVRW